MELTESIAVIVVGVIVIVTLILYHMTIWKKAAIEEESRVDKAFWNAVKKLSDSNAKTKSDSPTVNADQSTHKITSWTIDQILEAQQKLYEMKRIDNSVAPKAGLLVVSGETARVFCDNTATFYSPQKTSIEAASLMIQLDWVLPKRILPPKRPELPPVVEYRVNDTDTTDPLSKQA